MIESKRSIIFFVGIFMMLVSCETNSDDFKELNKIEFEYSDSKEITARGTATDNTTIDNFGVYAYYTEGDYNESTSVPNFMFNTKVSRTSSTSWTYNPVMYWPVVGGVSFFAYSPHDDPNITLGSTPTTKGAPLITYTVPNEVVNHRDLLISKPLYNQTKTSLNNVNKKLTIPFKHALSAIIFQARVDQASPTYVIKVKSVTIGKLKNKATVNYTTSDLSSDISLDAIDMNYKVQTNKELEDLDISNIITYTNISTADGKLMLLPQTIDETDKVTVVVEMNIGGTVTERTSVVKLSDLIPTMERAKMYSIKINVLGLADVDLEISVNTWKTATIDVPEFN